MSIQLLPTSLLYQIISSVPFPSLWETSLVCKSWYFICTDPYLYQDIHLEGLELKLLVKALHWIEKIKKGMISVRRLNIRHCYCDFLATTIVPITTPTTIPLYSQLRTLTPKRRHLIYQQHGFQYYDQLSSTLTRLLTTNTKKLTHIAISHCDLDWAMTRLFDVVIHFGAGRHLTTWIYHDNYSNDQAATAGSCAPYHQKPSTTTTTTTTEYPLEGLIRACPEMKHFMGHHALNDRLLMTMACAWPQLESLVIMPSDDTISAQAFYSFLSHCPSLHTLALYDLACMNPVDVIHPPASAAASVRHVTLTKFSTTPLTTQAIQHLLDVFPYLRTLTYETNRLCFDLHHQHQQWPPIPPPAAASDCEFEFRLHRPPTINQLLLHTSQQVMKAL